jgi:hypothetical protein
MIGVAVVLALVAIFSRPRLNSADLEATAQQLLFPDLSDANAPKSLTITDVDKTTNSLKSFEVADVDGRWVVPSHHDYPAIAKDHVIKVASEILGLKVLRVESDSPTDQQEYGVVEPGKETAATSNLADVGELVVIKDAAGKDLARLIVGKEDKKSAGGAAGNLRFVRLADRNRIYRVSLDTELLTTKFQDWVDTDILGLKQHWDINRLLLRDYALESSGARKDIELAVDDKGAWSIEKLTEFKDDKPQVTKLPAGEELDSSKINDLKSSLSALKLVDVAPKPASFADELKSGKDYFSDPQARQSLHANGFECDPKENPTNILSIGDDLTVGMKDGVEYTVRFGAEAFSLQGGDSGEKSGDKKGAAASKDAKHSNTERIMFVTARFNPDLIPKPVTEPLPEVKRPEVKKPEVKKPEAKKPAGEDAKEKTLPEVTKPETNKPAADKPDAKPPAKADQKPADAAKGGQTNSHLSGELLALADPADEPQPAPKAPADEKKPDPPKTTDAKTPANAKPPTDQKPDDKKPEPAKPEPAKTEPAKTEPGKPVVAKPEPAKPVVAKPKTDQEIADEEAARDQERKRIDTENRQKQDEYDKTVKGGKAHAKELNDRFAGWYYLISEDDYKKVHVGLSDLVKKKAAPETGAPAPGAQNPFPASRLGPFHP